ncbi:MAG: hypothetical protein H0V86_06755, partial [Chloroflexia bacterium]|nr:hypothetical protein [Chloroflexia bacterium]
MSAAVQPALSARPHNNRQLFSDYYLDSTLPGRADFRSLAAEARPVLEAVRRVLDGYAPGGAEADAEHRVVRPVLDLLGHAHAYEVQPSLETREGTKKPDYVFYRDRATLDAHKGRKLTDAALQQGAFAVGEAEAWNRPLSRSITSARADKFTNANPSFQIYFYIEQSGLEWGILTNGKLWRLYHRHTAHKLDRYYEVDLEELAQSGDAERFRYFYAFFRRAAFEPHPLGLSALLAESEQFARGVGESLKVQVYQALRHLAQGFLDYEPNGLRAEPVTLAEVYEASLIVLYRLLFVLYAESRELLPVWANDDYRHGYSLQSLKQEIARGRRLLPTSAKRWHDLRALWGVIDRGSSELGVPTFNGGLFDPEKHPFLERYAVG